MPNICLTKDWYPRFVKNSFSSIIRQPKIICAGDVNKYVTKDYIQMANKHIKKYSTSLVIREINVN